MIPDSTNFLRRFLVLVLVLAGSAGLAQAQNVGIGTTAPTQTLDVNGSLRVRGLTGSGSRLPVVQPDGTLGLSAPLYQTGPAASGAPAGASGSVITEDIPTSVAVSGTTAYVVSRGNNSLQVFDVSAPSAPKLLGTVGTGNYSQSVAVSGATAYVVNLNGNSLQVFDASTPSAPKLLGAVATGSSPTSVAVSGTTAYVVNLNGNSLQVFDASTPSAPKLLGAVATGNYPQSVAVSGTTAYVVNGSNSLQVFDVSAPSAPKLLGAVGTGDGPTSVAVNGTIAYVVNQNGNSLQVFDVSASNTPKLLGAVGTGAGPTSVAVNGTTVYVVNLFTNNLQVFDVSAPSVPKLLGAVGTGTNPTSVAVSGATAYVVNLNGSNLQVFVSPTNSRSVVINPDGSLASVAASSLPGDNLGNHIATQNLNLAGFDLTGAGNVSATTLTASTSLTTPTAVAPATGGHNLLPVAYGVVGGTGTDFGSTGNYTTTHTNGSGVYRLTFSGSLATANLNNATVTATLFGNYAGLLSYSGGTGYVDVYTYNNTGSTAADRGFSFSIFLP